MLVHKADLNVNKNKLMASTKTQEILNDRITGRKLTNTNMWLRLLTTITLWLMERN